jgi:hypothetical protein
MSQRQKRARLSRRRRAAVRALGAGGGALAAGLVPASGAQAASSGQFLVTNLNDSGPGSLRQAITDADAAAGNERIVFRSGLSGDVKLKSALPQVTTNLDIEGPGARVVTLDASAVPYVSEPRHNPVLEDQTPDTTLAISGLSMDNSADTFVLVQPYVTGVVNDDTFASDSGGAVYANGYQRSFTIENSTFSHDGTCYGRAGVEADSTTLYMVDSTVTGSPACPSGTAPPGVHLYGSPTTITGSTIAENSGGGIQSYGAGSTPLTLQDSIVADNGGSDVTDSAGPLTADFSLIKNATGLSGLGVTDITGKDPKLGALQNNGGPTDTEMPKAGSPAIDHGKAFGMGTDQRGLARTVRRAGSTLPPGGDGTDIGAVELQPPSVSRVSPATAGLGREVTITGANFTDATGVRFGGKDAVFEIEDSHHLLAAVPPGSGTVDVRVISPDGESKLGPADRFTYPLPKLMSAGLASTRRQGSKLVVVPGITLDCPMAGGQDCSGLLSGRSTVPVRPGSKRKKSVVVGGVEVRAFPGQKLELSFALNKAGMRALQRTGQLRIHIEARIVGGPERVSKTITIQAPRKR